MQYFTFDSSPEQSREAVSARKIKMCPLVHQCFQKKKRYNCHSFTKDWPEMFYPSSVRTPVSFFCLFARTVKEIVLVSNLMSQGCQQKKEKSYISVLLGFFWHSSFDVINNFFPG